MYQNQAASFPINSNVVPLNYYQQMSVPEPNFGDSNWFGWPLWIATDVIVSISDRQFHAHRTVLISNSGYFRSELSLTSAPDKQGAKQTIITPSWSICVTPKTFSIIMDFMYTSRLPLDSANVVEVLAAAQIMMIPRAIELCRGFLLQRHLTGCLTDFYSVNRNFPPQPHFSPSENAPPFFSTGSLERCAPSCFGFNQSSSHCFRPSGSHPIIRPIPSKFPLAAIPSTSTATNNATSLDEIPSTSGEADSKLENNDTFKSLKPEETNSTNNPDDSTSSKINSKSEDDNAHVLSNNDSIKEFVDIACCDGPVKFQRVLNANCNLVVMMINDEKKSIKPSNENEKKDSISDESIDDSPDNNSPLNTNDSAPKSTNKQAHYRCIYCRHTYKSLCCYLKHKQRHINPKSKLSFKIGNECPKKDNNEEEIISKEADIKEKCEESGINDTQEINVPFYPCRICGLKFPSYYFVHKHQRACHKTNPTEASN